MKILNLSNKIIEYSFYALFFMVPLVFWKDTSELYELNKMWLTFGLTLFIAASWTIKSIVLKKFYLQKTPLDIPIALFLLSQLVSTIFSLDPYVSFWGYYSRFNGGLLSTISYIFLYYAFLSNFSLARGGEKEGLPTARMSMSRERALAGGKFETGPRAIDMVKRLLMISLASATLVALWGLPSRFGYDPTCLIFRGSFDVSCWTADFQPKLRIFSTLGQPAWLGAYLAVLSPIALAFALQFQISNFKFQISRKYLLFTIYYLLPILFYLDLLFTRSRAALLGFWVSVALFALYHLRNELQLKFKNLNLKKVWSKTKPFSVLLVIFLVLTAIILNPIELNKGKVQKAKIQTPAGSFSSGGGGTESGKIRLYVWQGALKAWLHNPIIGTGVETFAFAYYKYKPVAHNLTSEWNYLYNKAHNEYFNFLATTGLFGLGTYLAIIATFLWVVAKKIFTNTTNAKYQMSNKLGIGNLRLVIIGIISGYLSILVTNFFGFSVVIVNLYLFLIPAFVFVLLQKLSSKNALVFSFGKKTNEPGLTLLQKVDIIAVIFAMIYFLVFLGNFWLADQAYSLGSNLVRGGEYSSSYSSLKEAVRRAGFEPTYKDELASNDAIFTVALLNNLTKDSEKQKETLAFAGNLAKEAISYVEEITKDHPNNVVFWKTKVRVYYTLSQIDPKYTKDALSAIKKAQSLAPTDANVFYNLGLLYGQSGETQKAIESLSETIKLKPNWDRPYYALGLFYRQMATDKNGKVVDEELNQKAIDQMKFILIHIDPNNKEAKDALAAFEKNQ